MKAANFNVTTKLNDRVAVIYPRGYLNNITGEDLVDASSACLGKGVKNIVLNFSETEFINSIGISLLLTIIERLRESGGSLCFTNMSKMYAETFQVLGLTKYVAVFDREEDALRHFGGSPLQ
ncbi:MAG: STAS domain-containing protein [Nitrospirota bacterium]